MQAENIGALEGFLTYGPIGFAAIMLVLVIVAMATGHLDETRSRLLRFFMIVGAVCFLAALAAEFFAKQSAHRMTVVVAPNDLGPASQFPPPIFRLNGELLDSPAFTVDRSGSLIVDVTESVGAYQTVSAQVEEGTQALLVAEQVNGALRQDVASLEAEVAERETALAAAERLSSELSREIEVVLQETSRPGVTTSVGTARALQDINSIQNRLQGVFR